MSEVIHAEQRFAERQIRAICARLPWAEYKEGTVVIETIEYPTPDDDNEPPPMAA